jgi:hypothetical protein
MLNPIEILAFAPCQDGIGALKVYVRSTPESRHVRCTKQCPLWAKSGHDPLLRGYFTLSQTSMFTLIFPSV